MSDETVRFDLPQSAIPTRWYNIQADLPRPLPPVLHPATYKPVGPEDLAPLFPMALIGQEVSTERFIEIPEEVREIYKLWRPTPLIRARRLEKALDTPAHIYFKYEGGSPSGSHKLNTAVPQAYYNKMEGVQGLTTETGAGQWGTALSIATNFFDLECIVYMVKVSYQQKPYRRAIIQSFGAEVTPSPSDTTEAGRRFLAEDPESTGSLGMAISEAVEVAVTSGGKYKYALGSVLNHVLMHQTVIGQEALLQLRRADAYPDVVIGCTGGGSNFAGIAFPFIRNNLNHGTNTRIVAVEPAACPTLTRGSYTYDYGDTAGMAPVVKMHTLGASFVPAPLHAGGLRYHGMASIISELLDQDLIEALAIPQLEVFGAALKFLRSEGIVPAPEPSHAIAAVVREALAAKEAGEKRTILFNLCGHGHFDMAAYDAYNKGELSDYEYPQEAIDAAMEKVPQIEGQPVVVRRPAPAEEIRSDDLAEAAPEEAAPEEAAPEE
ncbi:MAG TPA: TrpB-like pyridoxal phosphate-dependent enzyme, partial [Nannocystis exedens]|nr:TrpB-like pyridoxal phosphate-dependent enzyme [Nannocystis exedens]